MRVRRPETRRSEMIDTALAMARAVGYQNVRLRELAERCDCSTGTVMGYFSTMAQLKRAIMSAAVAREDLVVLAQGIVAKEAKALAAKPELKRAAMEHML